MFEIIKAYAGENADMSEKSWPSMPRDQRKVVLLVDSWAPDKGHSRKSDVSEHTDFRNLLMFDGCTEKIQPLDVHVSRQYKSFIRCITDALIIGSMNVPSVASWLL